MNKTFAIMATALALASCSSNKNVRPMVDRKRDGQEH